MMKFKKQAALLVVVLLALTACGGDSGSDGVASIEDLSNDTTSTTSAVEDELIIDEDQLLQFTSCMRDEGIDFPDPVVNSDGNVGFDLMAMRDMGDVPDDEMQAAFDGCFQYLEGVNFGFERIFDAEFQDQVVVFAGCMRDNGIDMPDPDFSGIMDGEALFPGWEPELDDPDFETAFDACEDQLPGIPGIAN